MTPAERWAVALRRAMAKQGVRQVDLIRHTGVRGSTARKWMHGRSVITPHNAAIVAEWLAEPELLTLCEEIRARVCPAPACGRSFTDHTTSSRATYCSERCQSVVQNRRHRAAAVTQLQITPQRLNLYRETVDAFCRDCGGSWCPMPECRIQLAGLSPLKVARRRSA